MPIHFYIETFQYITLSGILLLGTLMLWKEWKRKELKWLILRIMAVFLLVFSLVFILLKPSINVEKKKQNVLFITPFSDSLKVAEWKQNNALCTTLDLSQDKAYLSESRLSELCIDTLIWSGAGFTEKERSIFKNIPTKWLTESLDRPNFYIDSLEASKEVSIKDKFRVGALLYSSTNGHTIVYEGFTGIKDSLITKAGFNKIRFQEQPKQAGQFVSKILLKNKNGNVYRLADVPVIVKKPDQISVLFLSSFPNFENRYLKEYLANQGHEVVYRVALSKEKFRDEFYNSSFQRFPELKYDIIKHFNFVLADALWLKESELSQINQLKTCLIRNNQTLIVLMNDNVSELKFLNTKLIFEESRTKNESIFSSMEGVKFSLSRASNSLQSGTSIIDGQEDLGTWIKFENSRIAAIHFTDSYRLILQDKEDAYSELWTNILSSLGKRKNLVEWDLISQWPSTQEKIKIDLTSSVQINKVKIFPERGVEPDLIQNSNLSSTYNVDFIAEHTGWYQIRLNNDSTSDFRFYVENANALQRYKQTEKLKDNLHFFNTQSFNAQADRSVFEVKKLAIWPFFILFLLSAGFLWLVPRI